MINVKGLVKGLIYKEGKTISDIVAATRNTKYDIPCQSTISFLLKTGRIRYTTVWSIADYLGYEICFQKKKL